MYYGFSKVLFSFITYLSCEDIIRKYIFGNLLLNRAGNVVDQFTFDGTLLPLIRFTMTVPCHVSGLGGGVTFISSSSAVMSHYHKHNTATSLGFLTSGQSVFLLLFISIYNHFFVNGHYEDPVNQDLGGFLVLMATCFGVLNLGGIFLYFPPQENNYIDHEGIINYAFEEEKPLPEEKVSLHKTMHIDQEKLGLTNGTLHSSQLKKDRHQSIADEKLSIYHSSSTETSRNAIVESLELIDTTKLSLCQLFTHAQFWCICLGFMIITGITEMHVTGLQMADSKIG